MPETTLKKLPFKLFLSIGLIIFSLNAYAIKREQIRIVGSATLYPFITIVAEEFGKKAGTTPVVEATGTGGGFRLFCSGNSPKYPDVVNASRKIKPSELGFCQRNNVNNIKEILIGYDGIVFAQSEKAKTLNLSWKSIFLALAKQIPLEGKMVNNYYNNWNEIDPSLPNKKIEIYGPSDVSGTRDAFIELVMQQYCEDSAEIQQLLPDMNNRKAVCSELREDGKYIEMTENYNLLIKKIIENDNALCIMSYSMLENNTLVKEAKINNISPSKNNIINGLYPLTRPLFLYFNLDHFKSIPKLEDFWNYINSSSVIGREGLLSEHGLITK